jgi:hypothetical protein
MKTMRTHQGTGYQESDDGGQFYPVADLEDKNGKPENYGNIL